MPQVLHYQPFKAAYLIFEISSTLLVRLPLWALLALPRSWRPRRSWSLKRVLFYRYLVRTLHASRNVGGLTKSPNHLAIAPGVEIDGVWVEPVPKLITGQIKDWATTAHVEPVRIPGYWLHKKGTRIAAAAAPAPGEKVVYCLHGGAYVRLSAHPSDPTANIARGFLEHVDVVQRTFSVEYRLSAGKPNHPFPAALMDALAGYHYLVNVVGFAPSDIIVEGDSAGGNLAHALVRYLVEYGDAEDVNLAAPPGSLVLLSPWVDMGVRQVPADSSAIRCMKTDYIGNPYGEGVSSAMRAFVGPIGLDGAEENRYISPASAPDISFEGFPRTFIVAGGVETLLDQIRVLRDRMARELGDANEGDGRLRYYESEDAWHDYLAFPICEPERSETLKEIAKWIG